MKLSPLHPRFGVEVQDIELKDVTVESGYRQIREAFERHSLLLFRRQCLDDEQHNDFASLFGPLEDRRADVARESPRQRPPLPKVSNRAENGVGVLGEDSYQVLDLKFNQLWHTDSTFLYPPALANVIAARIVPSRGGETQLVSTRAAWRDIPPSLRARAKEAVLLHRLGHSRGHIDASLGKQAWVTQYDDQAWRAIWPNPVTGEEALYVASHAFCVQYLSDRDGRELITELINWCTQPEYVYTHHWAVGDVMIWDERATMHRGRPWPYTEERTMASCCVSAQACDGVDQIRALV